MSTKENLSSNSALNRRHLMAGAGGMLAASSMLSVPAFAQKADVSLDDLMKSDEGLHEMVLGPADAKIVIVEYASMTCGACGAFHAKVFPEIKKKYIDTGKVRFVMREFARNSLDAAASLLARCGEKEQTYSMFDALLATQNDWVPRRQGDNPIPKFLAITKQAGFRKNGKVGLTEDELKACLGDAKQLEYVTKRRDRAAKVFGVNQTPTFFINGKKLVGGTFADFEKVIEPLLAKS